LASDILNNEEQLLSNLAAGDQQAFDAIYWHYSPALYRNIIRLIKSEDLANELLQDIFIKLWERRKQLTIQTTLANYLMVVSRNAVADMFRKIKRDKNLHHHIIEIAATELYQHTIINDDTGRAAVLNKAIETLPPARAKVFRLIKIEGKSYQEVSKELGISTSTISDHIVKATKSIRTFLENHPHITENLLLLAILRIFF
jgi:RNA polymerase sigma-70 factor (family 1)